MIYIRSVCFYIGEGLSAIPFFFVSLIAMPLPAKQRSRLIAGWANFVTWWLGVTCGLKHELSGEENIPDTPCVFACNHQSTWESIVTQTFLPALAWVIKKELLRIPFFGWGLWASRPIAIDRFDHKSARNQVTEQGVRRIQQGRHVLIFPEGTRTAYGKTGKYQRGAAMLAREAGVEVVPIAHNAGKYWSRNSWWIKPGTIQCMVGPAISLQGRTDREVTELVKQWIAEQAL